MILKAVIMSPHDIPQHPVHYQQPPPLIKHILLNIHYFPGFHGFIACLSALDALWTHTRNGSSFNIYVPKTMPTIPIQVLSIDKEAKIDLSYSGETKTKNGTSLGEYRKNTDSFACFQTCVFGCMIS